MTGLRQLKHDMAADVTGAAGNQNAHVTPFFRVGRLSMAVNHADSTTLPKTSWYLCTFHIRPGNKENMLVQYRGDGTQIRTAASSGMC